MTVRSVLIGFLLAFVIAATTYFNDSVVRQTPLIGHFLPAVVVGPVVALALLGALCARRGRVLSLRPAELLIITAMGLAACGYPGNGFFRWFATNQAQPAHLAKQRTDWRATDVFSYVPRDRGVLLLNGEDDDRVIEGLRHGLPQDSVGLADVPWQAWRPVITRWGGIALILGMAGLCLAVVVHPQWSRHEQVAYPIVRFMQRVVATDKDGRPTLGRLFYWGMSLTISLHLINGLAAWGYSIIEIPMSFSFKPLADLFPNAAQAGGAWALFEVTLIPSVIAFSWFVSTRVSLSVGLANPIWVFVGGLFIASGASISRMAGGYAPQSLSLGACLGIAAMIAYVGRRHYLAVFKRCLGLPDEQAVPASCVWAGRLLAVLVGAAVFWLSGAGLHWSLALLFVLLTLLMFLVITRINVETGLIFIQIGYAPGMILLAWFGFESIGPGAALVLLIANVMLLADPRQTLMVFFANGLRLSDQAGQRPARAAPILAVVAVMAFFVAGLFTLTTQYRLGMDQRDWPAKNPVPSMPFDTTAKQLTQADAYGTLDLALQAQGFDWLQGLGHEPGVIVATMIGLTLVLACAVAMLRLTWWPLHPVVFVIVGTLPSMLFGWSFLIGWAIKVAAIRFGGVGAYKQLTPLVVGVIAGEVLAILGWIIVGWLFYHQTGTLPPSYKVLLA